VCHKSFEEYGAAVRAGVLVTPALLVFGKGGYVNNEQRKRFDAPSGLYYVNGQIVGPEQSYNNHVRTDGYQFGGGVEYSLGGTALPLPVTVSAQYVYANYDDHTARQRAMLGIGVRFK
jgi:outer membrane immunogenic protein